MRIHLTFLLFLGSLACIAQSYPWEGGLLIGSANAAGDLVAPDASSLKESTLGAGLFVRRDLTPNVGLRLSLFQGKLTGEDANYEGRENRGFSFTSPLTELSLTAVYDILGHKRYDERGNIRRFVSPYVFLGLGGAFTNADTDFRGSKDPGVLQDMADGPRKSHFTVPFGLGAKYYLSERWVIGVEAGLRPVFNDRLDGMSQAGNPDRDDWYGIGSLSLGYRFGSVDSDKDGVPDHKDECPTVFGLKELNGCPDADGDGVPDHKDECPQVPGLAILKGCPDRDGDGVPDHKDECPDIAGKASLGGCPDLDNDGIPDHKDDCPETPGIAKFKGCPDTDGDGIPDKDDACPTEFGPASNKGCPIVDRDGDGVLDVDDECPDVPGLALFRGCPDTDGDGIPDHKDDCPNLAGTAENNGCPASKQELQETLDIAVRNVEFETGRFALTRASYAILDGVADIMNNYPGYNIDISGYTDSQGNDAVNQQLSENRVAECRRYLVSKGVSNTRMTAKGYGSTNPIATNNTPAGRQLNRRVEFKLIKK